MILQHDQSLSLSSIVTRLYNSFLSQKPNPIYKQTAYSYTIAFIFTIVVKNTTNWDPSFCDEYSYQSLPVPSFVFSLFKEILRECLEVFGRASSVVVFAKSMELLFSIVLFAYLLPLSTLTVLDMSGSFLSEDSLKVIVVLSSAKVVSSLVEIGISTLSSLMGLTVIPGD